MGYIIFERLQSDYLNADSIRIHGVYTNVHKLDEAIKRMKPTYDNKLESKMVALDEIISIDLNIWRHDDAD